MSGADNIYKYITTEGKIYGEEAKKFTMLEYLQKSTGVFNQDGMLSKAQVKEMRKRAQYIFRDRLSFPSSLCWTI